MVADACTTYGLESKPTATHDIEKQPVDKEKSPLISNKNSITKPSLWQGTSLRQKFLLLDLVFLNLIVNGCAVLSFPFFSRVVAEKGGSVFISALILETVMVTQTIGYILFGIYQRSIGPRRLFYIGLVITGIFQIASGCLEFVEDIKTFTALGIIFNAFTGLGISGHTVAIYAVIVPEYSGHVSMVFGLIFTAYGCSRFVGPTYSGYVYDLYGMFVPLAIWGAIIIFATPMQRFLLDREMNVSKTENFDSKNFFLKASNLAILALNFVVCGVIGYLDVIFTVYLQTLGLSVTYVGLGMLVIGVSMALSSPAVGYLAGKGSWITPMCIIGGSTGLSATLLLFSPGQMVVLVYVACVLFGMTTESILVPTFEVMLRAANGGPITEETNVSLYCRISGILYAFMGAGSLTVPLVSTAIQTATKASISMILYSQAGILLFFAVILTVCKLTENYNKACEKAT